MEAVAAGPASGWARDRRDVRRVHVPIRPELAPGRGHRGADPVRATRAARARGLRLRGASGRQRDPGRDLAGVGVSAQGLCPRPARRGAARGSPSSSAWRRDCVARSSSWVEDGRGGRGSPRPRPSSRVDRPGREGRTNRCGHVARTQPASRAIDSDPTASPSSSGPSGRALAQVTERSNLCGIASSPAGRTTARSGCYPWRTSAQAGRASVWECAVLRPAASLPAPWDRGHPDSSARVRRHRAHEPPAETAM
jgi:hypothetical protein